MIEKNYLTKEGLKKLNEELMFLQNEKLPSVLERLKEAVGQGDISENAEYETAIQEKDLIESRINELKDLLNNVEIIEEGIGSGIIKYGSKVQLIDEKNQIVEYTIVGSGEVDILNNTISFDSPLGIAIKGKKEGDEISVRAPRGRNKMKILKVT